MLSGGALKLNPEVGIKRKSMAQTFATYAVLTRTTPATCRNTRLRMSGIRPDDARYIRKLSDVRVDLASTPLTWIYVPGNSSDHPWLRDRGLWRAGRDYMAGGFDTITGRYIQDYAWHHAARWQCLAQGTTEEPGPGASDWMLSGTYSEIETLIVAVPTTLPPAQISNTIIQPSATLFGETLDDGIVSAAGFGPTSWSRRRMPRNNDIIAGDTVWAETVGKSLGLSSVTFHQDSEGTGYKASDVGVTEVSFAVPLTIESDTEMTVDAILCLNSEQSPLQDSNGEILIAKSKKYSLVHRSMAITLKPE